MPDPDLLAELDEASIAAGEECWCGRHPEVCEDAGGCAFTRLLAHVATARDKEIRHLTDSLREASEAIARVRALHVRSEKPRVTHHLCSHHAALDYLDRVAVGACPDCATTEGYVCQHCRHECPDDDGWPCATIRALEGR